MEPPWFKQATFYELDVRGFFDSNDDGTGDLRGVAHRIDYLTFLGVDCICLLLGCLCTEPAGGDGTMAASVRRDQGSLADLRSLIEAAHANGIRVVLDLSVDATGPDAVSETARSWLELDVDGFRVHTASLPAGPNVSAGGVEQEGDAHGQLKRLRAELDARHPNRVLIARPNSWAVDAAAYFGEGDECHMVFHFPLMARMFMALRREEAKPIYELLELTPDAPAGCTWGLFLRIHDELTLEMVTDAERDFLHADYAKDPRMKLNLAVRRRLAPLLDNGRDEMELIYAILFSLPGSPTLYYGDEIGMGDNPSLGARDSIGTPMQWTGDRNGGFSRADWAQLYLQPLMDPVYGYQAVNVEAQLRTPTSLLSWLHRFVALRKEHGVFGMGGYEPLHSANPRIFAHVRQWGDDVVVCVHNLASSAQPVELDLSAFRGRVPEELFGSTRFPPIGELPYLLTLKPRGFFWFRLLRDEE